MSDCNDIFCDGGELPVPAPVVPFPAVPVVGGGGGSGSGESCGEFVSSWASTCALTKSGCPRQVCDACPSAIDSNIRSCCSADLPYTCFQSVLGGGGSGGASETPATVTDANLASCATAIAYVSACQSLTSDFASLAASDQASCLCYDANNNFAPSVFDGAWSACAAYASTADTTDYSFYSANEGLCASAANGAAGASTPSTSAGGSSPATATPSVTPQSGSTASPGTATATVSPSSTQTGSAARNLISKKTLILPLCFAVACLSGAVNSFV